MRIKDF